MDRARISVDFNSLDSDDTIPLSGTDGTDFVIDSDGNTIVLSAGMDIYIYEDDFDVFNRQDNLIADGIVVRNPGNYSTVKWYCQINESGIRHESDDPSFRLPELPINEKRNIIYSDIQRCVSAKCFKKQDRIDFIEFYIKILKKIDNGEL
ncbi:MAG: hypothetical protein FWE85_01810 [Clostridiales bacterium]|nr:hypothetical protein [Clostridiales bacterium]